MKKKHYFETENVRSLSEDMGWNFIKIKDLIFAPFRLTLFPDELSTKMGLTSLEEERINAALPYCQGKVLDVGCGKNILVKKYGNGVGIDIYDWGGGAILVEDSSNLPFSELSFDTITFLASLNHIPNREEVLKESRRLLKNNGRIIITMINPILGYIGHKIWWYAEDKKRGMQKGEAYGLWKKNIIDLANESNLKLIKHKRFLYFLNNLYIFKKADRKK